MRLHSRPVHLAHANTQGRRHQRLWCTSVFIVPGEGTPAREVWQLLSPAGSATSIENDPARKVDAYTAAAHESGRFALSQVDFAACAWRVLLRAAECPLEQQRTDHQFRARTRHLHHRASSKSPALAGEKDLHRKAMYHSRKGHCDEAVRLLKRGLQQYPHNSFFPHSLGVMMLKQSNLKEAQAFLTLALDVDGGNSAAYQALGGVYSKMGEGAKARSMFENAIKMDPGNAAAYQAWALLEKKQGNTKKSRQLLELCLERNPKHEPSLHALAKLHMDLCHFVQARKLLQRVLRINPSHPHSWTTLGELCYYQGDPIQARRIFEQSVAYCGEDSVSYSTWAHMEARMGDNGKARRLLERAIEIAPRNVQAHTQLLTLLCNDPHLLHMAPAQFQATLNRFPENIHIRHLSASFLMSHGHHAAAEAILLELADVDPANGRIAHTQAMMHIQNGQREQAARCLRRGMGDGSRQNGLLCTEELAKLALVEGRPDIAQELFQYGAAQHVPTSRYLREWGMMERKLGNTATSRSLFQQSVESRAMDVRSWVAWAVLERSCDDLPKALEVLRQALTAAPKVTTLWYLYCDTAVKCLPLRSCRELFKEAHRCVPRCPQIYLLEATLEWKSGYDERARQAFKHGSRYASGSPEYYSPLFEAWAQFEESCGNVHAASMLVQRCANVDHGEQKQRLKHKDVGSAELAKFLGYDDLKTVQVAVDASEMYT